jgi:hypothetical protein
MTVCALATSCDPTTFTIVITMMMAAANTLIQTALSCPVSIELA